MSNQATLDAPVAVVTGGAQGIGKGIAQHLLALSWRVMIGDVDAEAGRETEAELADLGDVRFVHADVTDEATIAALMAQTAHAWGRLDALINNAGIAAPGNGPVEELDLGQWQRVLDTNLTGPLICVKHAVPHLRQAGGAIVNIASTRALQSEANTEAYSASKGGLVALTHALAISLGPAIRVNCISPGWIDVALWKKSGERRERALRAIDHAQHPVGRVGTPQDVASMVAFLISDEAGFITGHNFVVDGGMTVKMIYAD
jgi:NAD(P)-dependent dehydrogenase (short-subunit alcohol dehydrogenase family)